MIIKYCDNEYLIYNEKDLKNLFKSLDSDFLSLKTEL